ncbi:hypothetical protein [Limosilactobacillus sp.]|uniref:hypothetical protein n=1 Tax=Limosilactobacillus sp. TaxID=2773925 RepID=UPI003EFC5775
MLLRQIAMAKDPNHPLDKILVEDITNAFSDTGKSGRTTGPSDNHVNMTPLPPLNNKLLPS